MNHAGQLFVQRREADKCAKRLGNSVHEDGCRSHAEAFGQLLCFRPRVSGSWAWHCSQSLTLPDRSKIHRADGQFALAVAALVPPAASRTNHSATVRVTSWKEVGRLARAEESLRT